MELIDLLCFLMITRMISCEDKGFIRVVARVGEDVVLPCSLGPEVDIEQALFDWMKDRQEVFLCNAGSCKSGDPQFRGRVSHFPDKLKNGDASIVIRNLTLSDSGNYSCYFPHLQEQRFYIELFVGFVRVVARVGEDVVLPCSLGPEVNIEPALFDWMKDRQEVFLYNGGFFQSGDSQFKGRVSHFPDKLKNGNASILIRNLTLSDSGNYSCYFPRLQGQRFYVELFVGIIAKPRAMILDITKDQALLQCEVRGAFPKPKISWIDSNGTVLPATEKLEDSDGLHYPPALTLQTNVTKPDIFYCQVTQEELNHTTEAQISTLILSDKNDKTVTESTGLHGVVALACLIGFILGLVVAGICWRCWRRSNRERLRAIFSREAKRPVMESQDNHDSSLHSSHVLANPQETREPTEEAEPDEALKTPLQKSTTSPNDGCQPFYGS